MKYKRVLTIGACLLLLFAGLSLLISTLERIFVGNWPPSYAHDFA
jgi:hypothetical protein